MTKRQDQQLAVSSSVVICEGYLEGAACMEGPCQSGGVRSVHVGGKERTPVFPCKVYAEVARLTKPFASHITAA